MRNIILNEAESIFEVLWNNDGGAGTYKYNCFDEWRMEPGEYGKRIRDEYEAVAFEIFPPKVKKAFPFWMERDCDLDISEYDRLIFRGKISDAVKFRMLCRIDGKEQEVMLSAGIGQTKEYTYPIKGQKLTHMRLEFQNVSNIPGNIQLSWFGLADTARLERMLNRENPYTPDWPGCFAENPVMEPQLNVFFDKADLERMRKQIAEGKHKAVYGPMRERALKWLSVIPEDRIGDGLDILRLFIRERDLGKPQLTSMMEDLAFVGLVEQNEEMLRLACRAALAACHCKSFADGYMTDFPGVTWHDRSFAEKYTCVALVKVLDWAGGLLTWHAKDIIEYAMIMKGIPRLDSDIKMLDDIWYTNQGLVYSCGLITALIAVSKRFPRYNDRIAEAEKNFMYMVEECIQADGGSTEGGSYFCFTMGSVIEVLMLLARHYGKTLEEYMPERLKNLPKYGEAIWSEVGDGFDYIHYSDTFLSYRYFPVLVYFLASMGGGDFWKYLSNQMSLRGVRHMDVHCIQIMALAQDYAVEGKVYPEPFISMPISGITTLRREDPALGRVALYLLGGMSYPGHAHPDKGAILLDAGGKHLLMDRGIKDYSIPDHAIIATSEMHNIVTAVKDGVHLNQKLEDFDITDEVHSGRYPAYVRRADYEEGKLSYEIDVTKCWPGSFRKNVRSVESPDAGHYTVHDSLEIGADYEVCFILNTYGEITRDGEDFLLTHGDVQLRVHTANWTADRVEFGPYLTDGLETPVNRLALYKGGQERYELTTELEVIKLEG